MFGEAARRLAGLAAQLLGWGPEMFWAATPAELADALMPPGETGESPTRDEMAALMALFPDHRR